MAPLTGLQDRTWPDDWTEKSWVTSANDPESGFPLQNLPFCAFQAEDQQPHLGVGIGDSILDLHASAGAGLFQMLSQEVRTACQSPTLNGLMECHPSAVTSLRRTLQHLLSEEIAATHPVIVETVTPLLRPTEGALFCLPVVVNNYTDFYASVHHATNVGRLFRPDQPLLPNYKFVPIGYHGRASSIVLSGTPIVRPRGQIKLAASDLPVFVPTQQLDFELEVAAYIAQGNVLGHPIPIGEAEQHLFGLSLLNDWSARDIQSWEYQPLGPFLGKSFATSVSPWVVTMAALAPYRVPLAARPEGDPEPLPYLASADDGRDALDLQLEVHLSSAAMRASSLHPLRLTTANLRDLYWSFPQMIAHHTSNGCNLLPGDLLGSGTISGAEPGMQGCLLEITRRGASPVQLPSGELRSFLEDGDEIILSGFCQRAGLPRIALGECRGTIISALA